MFAARAQQAMLVVLYTGPASPSDNAPYTVVSRCLAVPTGACCPRPELAT